MHWAANWVQVGAGQVSAGAAEDTRLALHPSTGARYVAYRDNANGGKCRWGGWGGVGQLARGIRLPAGACSAILAAACRVIAV